MQNYTAKLYCNHAELAFRNQSSLSLRESLHAISTCFVVVESNVRLQIIKMKTLSSVVNSACIANLRCRADIFISATGTAKDFMRYFYEHGRGHGYQHEHINVHV
jgi:hypothetical protein